MKEISIITLVLILAVFNFLLRKGLFRLKNRSKIISELFRYLPIAELLLWISVIYWSTNRVIIDPTLHLYINILFITMGFVFISWFFMRDLICGIQIKSRFKLSSGQSFKSKKVNGIIKTMGLLLLEIKTDSGSELKIPYAQIDQKSIELNFQEKSGGESVVLIRLDEKLKEEDTLQKIMKLTMNSPWISHKSIPRINVKEAEAGLKIYEISCITNTENGDKKLKELIEQEIGQKKKSIAGSSKKQ